MAADGSMFDRADVMLTAADRMLAGERTSCTRQHAVLRRQHASRRRRHSITSYQNDMFDTRSKSPACATLIIAASTSNIARPTFNTDRRAMQYSYNDIRCSLRNIVRSRCKILAGRNNMHRALLTHLSARNTIASHPAQGGSTDRRNAICRMTPHSEQFIPHPNMKM